MHGGVDDLGLCGGGEGCIGMLMRKGSFGIMMW